MNCMMLRPALLALTLALSLPTLAQNAVPLGSTRTVTAEPLPGHPKTTPMAVPLFRDFTFRNYDSQAFSYTAPLNHGQRWAKIILRADFAVSAGRQFDRTGEISLGGTNIFFGTTAEPSDKVSPAWQIERDLTDYAALFARAKSGEVTLGNIVDDKYTGVIHGTATLLFYPAGPHTVLPPTADVVLPLPNTTRNGQGSADKPTDVVRGTYALPTNCVRAYLDLITESQGDDEFWYLNVPDALTKTLQAGGGTAFREAEVTVDGKPAGVAPVFPWIYTGGIDPSLWGPIPGIQTLNFVPYRVDLTPFAGVLNNGRPHTIGVRVVNNQNHFVVAGVLMLFRDPKLTVVHGALTADTLTDPSPVVTSSVTDSNRAVSGPVSVQSKRRFTISGYALTSAGRVTTTLTQTVGFSSRQQFVRSKAKESQSVTQTTSVQSRTTTQTPASVVTRFDEFRYPLAVQFGRVTNPDGTASQTTSIRQGRAALRTVSLNGEMTDFSQTGDLVAPASVLEFDAAGKLTRRTSRTVQTYFATPRLTDMGFGRTVAAENGAVTSDSTIGAER